MLCCVALVRIEVSEELSTFTHSEIQSIYSQHALVASYS
jgi:hypothetical protein